MKQKYPRSRSLCGYINISSIPNGYISISHIQHLDIYPNTHSWFDLTGFERCRDVLFLPMSVLVYHNLPRPCQFCMFEKKRAHPVAGATSYTLTHKWLAYFFAKVRRGRSKEKNASFLLRHRITAKLLCACVCKILGQAVLYSLYLLV